MSSLLAYRVVRRILGKSAVKAKRMVIMVGPPAAGKGFILGEPEKDDDGKLKTYKDEEGKEKETRFGYKLPQMLKNEGGKPLFSEDDIPDAPDQDESDAHLRAIQYDEARTHYEILSKAHKKGKTAFKEALDDLWYETKDGNKISLSGQVSFKDFPKEWETEDNDGFFDKTVKDFYVSMRGWHDEHKQLNEETGKPTESFKDAARHSFDEAVQDKLSGGGQSGLFIMDSAGEDIDTQDWKGQIETAKANGYEVSVVFLHPEEADTDLSNLARGKVQGKRMVDKQDVANWYEQNEQALKDIEAAAPDNFMHFRKGPPGQPPEEAARMRDEARELMENLAGMDDGKKKAAKKKIMGTLYGSAYEFNADTSYGRNKSIKNDKPASPPPISEVVSKLNEDAETRAKATPSKSKKAPKKDDEGTSKKPDDKPKGKGKGKGEESGTRMDFLRDVGDKMVANPNPKSRKRYPQVKVRSLPWEKQKNYYQDWRDKAAATRVAHRYIAMLNERIIMADEKSWLATWVAKMAKSVQDDLKVPVYRVETSSSRSPVFHVTLHGAAEDVTTAKKARHQIIEIMEQAIKAEMKRPNEWDVKVNGYNKGDDLVFACEIVFPH